MPEHGKGSLPIETLHTSLLCAFVGRRGLRIISPCSCSTVLALFALCICACNARSQSVPGFRVNQNGSYTIRSADPNPCDKVLKEKRDRIQRVEQWRTTVLGELVQGFYDPQSYATFSEMAVDPSTQKRAPASAPKAIADLKRRQYDDIIKKLQQDLASRGCGNAIAEGSAKDPLARVKDYELSPEGQHEFNMFLDKVKAASVLHNFMLFIPVLGWIDDPPSALHHTLTFDWDQWAEGVKTVPELKRTTLLNFAYTARFNSEHQGREMDAIFWRDVLQHLESGGRK